MKDISIIVMDMQPEFLDPWHHTEQKKEDLINSINGLVRYGIAHDSPIFFVEYGTIDPQRTIPLIAPDIREKISLFIKSGSDTFSNIGEYHPLQGIPQILYFDEVLQTRKIIIAGVQASKCIKDTIEKGIQRGYQFRTAPELISDNKENAKKQPYPQVYGGLRILVPTWKAAIESFYQ
ncbi:hypothetical protein J4228_02625 [Candidatus Woesearchaeota archaeon]|nr:hypothetical protein [Candidatus Woesearchaeota archaeon]